MFQHFFGKPQDTYTLEKHLDNMANLIKDAEQSIGLSDNTADFSNAQNQINFAKELHQLGSKFVKTSMVSKEKLDLGRQMSGLTKKYFGENEVPDITGTHSALIADILLKNNFDSFTKVEFPAIEKNLSVGFASSLGVESIPQQVEKTRLLKIKIENELVKFNHGSNPSNAVKKY